MITEELKEYIEKNIFPLYEKCYKGHDIEHIQYTIDRAFEIIRERELNIDWNIIYVIAAYHDLGHYLDKDNHEKISAEIMMKDSNLKNWFKDEELNIIKEAIEDHRASSNTKPRSLYGQIMKLADKNIELTQYFYRAWNYSLKHFPQYTEEEHLERVYEHGKAKFGEEGYARMDFTDSKYENYLEEFKEALEDKEKFKQKVKEYVKKQ